MRGSPRLGGSGGASFGTVYEKRHERRRSLPAQAKVTRSLKLARVARSCDHFLQVIIRASQSRNLLALVTRPLA